MSRRLANVQPRQKVGRLRVVAVAGPAERLVEAAQHGDMLANRFERCQTERKLIVGSFFLWHPCVHPGAVWEIEICRANRCRRLAGRRGARREFAVPSLPEREGQGQHRRLGETSVAKAPVISHPWVNPSFFMNSMRKRITQHDGFQQARNSIVVVLECIYAIVNYTQIHSIHFSCQRIPEHLPRKVAKEFRSSSGHEQLL